MVDTETEIYDVEVQDKTSIEKKKCYECDSEGWVSVPDKIMDFLSYIVLI